MSHLYQARDPNFENRVRSSFSRQTLMQTLGVTLSRVAPGAVDLVLQFRADLAQQHGFLHAGIVTAVLDTAGGYAALSLMEPGTAVLSVEFKVQLLAPARGEWFLGSGRVVRSGRTLTVVNAELQVHNTELAADEVSPGGEVVALLTGTMMTIRDRQGLSD